jgi:ATP sulfurylase
MRVEEIYERDREREALAVCGTADPRHPLVAEMNSWPDFYASGELRVIAPPRHYDFKDRRERRQNHQLPRRARLHPPSTALAFPNSL